MAIVISRTCFVKRIEHAAILRYVASLPNTAFMAFTKRWYCPYGICICIHANCESSQECFKRNVYGQKLSCILL